ncbi:MAG: CYTH domain-containing protein [Candidatus Liptonbacteria bacterium]|nr:CYTH domain-containing protein [Candidatus Liptonbacteria bacterium]
MQIEYEATFVNIDKDKIRIKLREIGAELVKPEFLQRRVVFNLPSGHEIKGGWLRVRDEGDKITMSLKVVDGDKIENQKEICLIVDSSKEAEKFLTNLGCVKRVYQENKRELWKLDNVEITIDEWPFLEPFVELEGNSEVDVKSTAGKLGFDYSQALFCAVGTLYQKKYGIREEVINNNISKITFDIENPFLNHK